LEKLELVLPRLKKAGIKAKKSFFGQSRLKCLAGFLIVPKGIKSVKEKAKTSVTISFPKNVSEASHSIRARNCHRDMCVRHLHFLAPLLELTSKKQK